MADGKVLSGLPDREIELFDVNVYRSLSADLAALSDDECRQHFLQCGKGERRIFADVRSAHDRLSMRWLRGRGIEIGPGSAPTRLFGASDALLADTDSTFFYGGDRADHIFSLDDRELFGRIKPASFDFAIASHVLEHVDSLIWGIRNLIDLVKPGGIVYAAVPCKEFLNDRVWLPYFNFQHHIDEFYDPLRYVQLHDQLVIDEHKRQTGEMMQLPKSERFLHHKHNYEFGGWLEMFIRSLAFLNGAAAIKDATFGPERVDCLVILERSAAQAG